MHGQGWFTVIETPANIFRVTPTAGQGYFKLVDFGLAHLRTLPEDGAWSIAGSPNYMAPEQFRGERTSVASDLYSMGVLAFELCSGDPPLTGTPQEILRGHEERAKRAERISPAFLRDVIVGLLKRDPAQRPTSARAVQTALRATPARPAPRPPPPASSLERAVSFIQRLWTPSVPKAEPQPTSRTPPPPPQLGTGTLELSLSDLEIVEPEAAAPLDPAQMNRLTTAALDYLIKLDQLPTFPVTALRVIQLLQRPDPEPGELARLINQDPALTAQVIRRANSAFSSRGVEIKSIRDAVTRLGVSEVASVAAASASCALFARPSTASAYLVEAGKKLQLQALSTAFGASWLAMNHQKGDSEQAFLGGLLHDIGKTLVLSALGDPGLGEKLGAFDPATQLNPLLEAVHVELGMLMAEEWKLPSYVIKICGSTIG